MHALKRSTDRRFWSSTRSIMLGCEGQAILVTAASLHHRLGGIVEPGSARRFDSLRLARDPPPFDGLCDGACTPSVCHQARCTPCTASVRRYYYHYRCAPEADLPAEFRRRVPSLLIDQERRVIGPYLAGQGGRVVARHDLP